MEQELEVKMPINEELDPEVFLAFLDVLNRLKIAHKFDTDNGRGSLLISLDAEQDARLLALWDELTDLRVRYIDAKQELTATQLSYLEGEEDATSEI